MLVTPDNPAPGSKEAIKRGCHCPVWDNHYGEGRPQRDGTVQYIYTQGCPLHDPVKVEEEE